MEPSHIYHKVHGQYLLPLIPSAPFSFLSQYSLALRRSHTTAPIMSNDTLPLSVSACLATPACKEAYQQIDYIPNLAGNALFLALFGIGLCLQIWFGFRFKTWGYLVAMFGGIVLEIIGYGARIGLHNNIFDNNQFIIYIVGLTIGPAFFSAAVYLSLGRIIAIFGSGLCWFKPKTITLAFISCDFLSLVLQAAGGAIASTSDTQSSTQQGINLMIAGLATQVAFTTIFCLVCLQLAWAIRKYPQKLDETYRSFRQTMRFRLYLGGK